METIFAIIALGLTGALYFLPAIVAYKRDKSNAQSIALLNTFLGWTLIGWVVALVWAVANDAPIQSIATTVATASTGDELLKLKGLLDAGAISQVEYDAQKARLLS